jgi:hypothetical protein
LAWSDNSSDGSLRIGILGEIFFGIALRIARVIIVVAVVEVLEVARPHAKVIIVVR